MSFTELAKEIAVAAHSGQFDKAGVPYIEHPKYVAEQMDSEDEKAVAFLHDVLEDTEVTAEDLLRLFPLHIVDAVIAITRQGNESYDKFIERVKQNPLACSVKLMDLRHNLEINRIPVPTEKDIARLEKYRRAYENLTFPTCDSAND